MLGRTTCEQSQGETGWARWAPTSQPPLPLLSPPAHASGTRVFLDTLARPLPGEAEQSVVLVASELVTDALRGGFGWPMVNRLAPATHVTATPGGGKTARALLPR
ncbi:hypothetical protein [Streptomyces sp. H27-H1]|uniref:hypothetical protein n=1 Tax=Streptomyces sp. H27-H1 TaxID=2996461 RepID=UPI002D1E494B|nr:hypothetical protein [Streptomyces sp. H27-H1]